MSFAPNAIRAEIDFIQSEWWPFSEIEERIPRSFVDYGCYGAYWKMRIVTKISRFLSRNDGDIEHRLLEQISLSASTVSQS